MYDPGTPSYSDPLNGFANDPNDGYSADPNDFVLQEDDDGQFYGEENHFNDYSGTTPGYVHEDMYYPDPSGQLGQSSWQPTAGSEYRSFTDDRPYNGTHHMPAYPGTLQEPGWDFRHPDCSYTWQHDDGTWRQ